MLGPISVIAVAPSTTRSVEKSPPRAAEGGPREAVPRACLFILKAQIALVYFYGGIAKLNGDWLRGMPLSSWLADRADLPVVGPWLTHPQAGLFFSYAGLLIDLSALIHGYLLVQRLVPLRHWLHPGDVNWNEEGHRFSWRMKLRDKEVSELSIHVIDPRTSLRELVDLEAWLTVRQIDEMSTRPDMLADFARFLADRWEAAAGVRPLVSVQAIVSLNGGPYRDLVDPRADLGAPWQAPGSAQVTARCRRRSTALPE
jgi:Vitamin K-dependent gamma-carboxylase